MLKKKSGLLSVILVTAMVFSMIGLDGKRISAEVTIQQMIADGSYNLALGKVVEAFPGCAEGSVSYLTDGKLTPKGDHAATTFGTTKTYYQIDLGAAYQADTIEQIAIGYKENSDGDTPVKGYEIQFSANGLDFVTVMTVDGASVKEACANNNLLEVESLNDVQGAVRYIRLYYPDSYTWGIQATEIAVLDTDKDAAYAQVEKCDDAAGIDVTVSDYNTITYQISAGINQEQYKYIVYLDNTNMIGNIVDAGVQYTVTGITAGTHTVKVIAVYDGKASEGIESKSFVVSDISELITSRKNVTNKNNNSEVQLYQASSIHEGHTLATGQAIVDGSIKSGEGTDVCFRTAAGTPQYLVIDLGDYYVPNQMEQVLLAYTNVRTYAADTTIAFSLDGTDYTTVGTETGYEFQETAGQVADLNNVRLNHIGDYTEKAVRFVKVTLSGGQSGYGYVVNEISLIASTEEPATVGSNIPEAADIEVITDEFEKIKYKIIAGENQQDASYVVKFAEEVINENAKANVEYEYEGIEAGTYTLKVSTMEDGWMSKGITKNVTVDGYINYIQDSLNLVYTKYHSGVVATCDADNKTDYLATSQEISAGVWALNNGVYTDYAHHTGYLQTRPDKETVNIVYDLGREYLPEEIYSVISMYEGRGNAATEYEIFFSATGEEDTYESVFYAKDVTWKQFLNDRVDVSRYTQDYVRYIRYRIITGNYARYVEGQYGSDGYHLCELAVMGKESLRPEAPSNVTASSTDYNSLTVTWDDVEDSEVTYTIYIDGNVCETGIPVGVKEKTYRISGGEHTVIVSSKRGELEHNSIPAVVTVKEETTTPEEIETDLSTMEDPTEQQTMQQEEQQTTVSNVPLSSSDTNVTTAKPDTELKKLGKSKIIKIKPGKKKVSLKFKKVAKASGYRVQYSLKKNFKKAKSITVSKCKAVIKKLKRGKRYYFRVQAYRYSNGKKVYGEYSKKIRSKKIH